MSRFEQLTVIGVIAVLAGVGGSAEAGGPAEDDLAVVRRAVAAQPTRARSEALPAPDAHPAPVPDASPARKAEAQWLRVRIKEKGGKSTVSVNLPLALARALRSEIPLDLGCRHKGDDGRAKIRLSHVLQSLDSGQDIIQVDGEDGSVRVWVE